MSARISSLFSKLKQIRLIEVAIAIAVIVGVVVVARMTGVYKEGLDNPSSKTIDTAIISNHAKNVITQLEKTNASSPIQVSNSPSPPI